MAARRALIVLLLPVLLLAQLIGLLHGIAHAPLAHPVSVAAPAAESKPPLAGLFQAHDDGTCRLFDQLSHGDAAPCVPVVLPALLPPTVVVRALHGLALARWAALFDARGPPALR
ncbi:hypothetical protein [Ramlibacter humi]|uniref:Uncharacterized protein n=1 Tax=Ramlibacter humi TaxID=2530451 RepID=A0A4Z0BP03_9BURK|nr:hypothetical protein [Ramlibacter humi]TFZ00150.1 hypothetical protein EZ216_13660 [Ramlibacter humi]